MAPAKPDFSGGSGSRHKPLSVALLEHAKYNEVAKVQETGFGPRYVIEGALKAPDGREPLVRTIWQVDTGKTTPRLITAYPVEEDEP